MEIKEVIKAIETHKTIRKAAKAMGKSYTAVQWCLATNGLQVVTYVKVEPRTMKETAKS